MVLELDEVAFDHVLDDPPVDGLAGEPTTQAKHPKGRLAMWGAAEIAMGACITASPVAATEETRDLGWDGGQQQESGHRHTHQPAVRVAA